ncbi:DoxX family protein [Streptomyces albiaxialis]|uniref:DoxX family protein n=1 Tax=Streptomyces albiaxialis TaxID=329523 RepID=A0ABP5IJN1_9ACTN
MHPTSPTEPTKSSAPLPERSAALIRRIDTAHPYVLSLFRIVVGLLFACHGLGSLFGVIGPAAGPEVDTAATGAWPIWYAAVIELVGGTLVMLGVGTRTAALLCSGEMAYAYFDTHAPEGLIPLDNGGEIAAFYCWAFLLLVCTGPGPLSLDRLFRGRRR